MKHVLKKFLALVDSIEHERKTTDHDVYQREFASLKELTESLKCDRDYSVSEGLKDVNRRKNRYKDILPCESSVSIVRKLLTPEAISL